MANHHVSINRGKTGTKMSEFREDTSTATIADVSALVAAVTAALAVLQADGASPTEAHVDTADTAFIALAASIAAAVVDNAADDIELRVADGASLTKKDVILALEAFELYTNDRLQSDFPKL